MFFRILAFAAIAPLLPTAAYAEDSESLKVVSTPPERISFLATFGEEECPPTEGEEIVVCANAPEGDRYRIPKKLRQEEEPDLAGGSWSSAVENLDNYARAERPNDCSVVGSNGFTVAPRPCCANGLPHGGANCLPQNKLGSYSHSFSPSRSSLPLAFWGNSSSQT